MWGVPVSAIKNRVVKHTRDLFSMGMDIQNLYFCTFFPPTFHLEVNSILCPDVHRVVRAAEHS